MEKTVNYRTLIKIEKCARCGYDEIKSSLHVHHIDEDRTNNNTSNLIVLCANCHHGLHHNQWSIEGRAITNKKPRIKYSGRRNTFEKMQTIITENNTLKNENEELKQKIKCMELDKPIYPNYENKIIMLSAAFIGHNSYKLRDEYVNFIDTNRGKLKNVDGEFGKNTHKIIQEHYSTPSEGEMQEAIEFKAII